MVVVTKTSLAPQKFHEWKIEKLHDIHEQHIGTRGPNTYKKMYGKLRQHVCYYDEWVLRYSRETPETWVKIETENEVCGQITV